MIIEPKSVHFIGIGGIGMSAIASILMDTGCKVSGSDLKLSPLTDKLTKRGARIFQGHTAENVGDVELVVITSAARKDNPEIQSAIQKGIPVIKRAEMLGRLMENRYGIAIAGTHGKTTTSSMVSVVMEMAGLSPTIIIGGEIVGLETNAKTGQGKYLVAEADEYDGSFLKLSPQLAVITNIEADHLDFYKSIEGIIFAFKSFAQRLPQDGHLVACTDDHNIRQLLESPCLPKATTYAIGAKGDWTAKNIVPNALGGSDFDAYFKDAFYHKFKLRVPGKHNVQNALAAIATANILGMDALSISLGLNAFRGAHRRFEIIGDVNGITIVDDYAHHPTEINATLMAARERFKDRRIICVFQPHTYSRTKLLLQEFAKCFREADEVIIADIYAARETDTLGIDSTTLVKAMEHGKVHFGGKLDACIDYLQERLKPDDVLITVGAGDINKVADDLYKLLSSRNKG